MSFYQTKPKIVEAIQLSLGAGFYSDSKNVGEYIFHYCKENDEGFQWWVVGPHGKIFYIRPGDYAIRLPDGTWGVAIKEDFEKNFTECGI